MSFPAVIILCILGGFCIIGAVFVMGYAFTFGLPKKSPLPPAPQAQPLPGSEGGGTYTMTVEGLDNPFDKVRLEAVLNAVPHTHSEADPETGTVRIRYEGFPALDLLDSLRKAAEEAGFPVKTIE